MSGGQSGTSVTLNRFRRFYFHFLALICMSKRSTVYLLLLITAVAVFFSVFYLILTRMFTKIIMHITLVLTILLNMYTLSFVSIPRELTFIILLQWYMHILLDN